MYSNGPLHMAEQKPHDQLEHTYSSSVRIRGVPLKNCQRLWRIRRSGERGSGISMLAARHDDDVDDDLHTVKWFQVLFSKTDCFIQTQLNGFKHSWWLNTSIWSTYETLTCTSPSAPKLHQLLRNIPLLYGLWSTSGSDRGNAHFFTATSNTIEGTGGKKKKKNKRLGLTQVQKESYVTFCMCRLTLVWTQAKLPQSNWNADSSWLDLLSLVWTLSHADSSFCPVSRVDWSLASPVANCQLLSPFVSLSDWSSLTTSGHVEIAGPKPFVWFRAKTDKGMVCLADHLHSATYYEYKIFKRSWFKITLILRDCFYC